MTLRLRPLTFAGIICLAPLALPSCDRIHPSGGGSADSDSTSVERSVAEVGRKLEDAAADLKSKIAETRIQAVLDNMRGFDGIEAQLRGADEVVLTGEVADELTRREAVRIVSRIKGVRTVRDSLRVGGVDTTTAPASGGK